MSNDTKSSVDTGDDSSSFASVLSLQGISVEDIVKGKDPAIINEFLLGQYNLLYEKYKSMEDQLESIKTSTDKKNYEMSSRIERILALMMSNLNFIKQMIKIEDTNNDKLIDQEKINSKQELQVASLIDRQNRFAMSLNTMVNNTKIIMSEIKKLKDKDVEHDKFQWKVTTLASISVGILMWLLTGDNLAKLIVFIMSLSNNK